MKHFGFFDLVVGVQEVNGSNPLASTTLSLLPFGSVPNLGVRPNGQMGLRQGRSVGHILEVGFGQRRLSFLRASLVI